VSFWRRLFNKEPAATTAPGRPSLRAQYQRKVRCYLEMIAAGHQARDQLAQVQAWGEGRDLTDPARVRDALAALVTATGQVATLLNELCRGRQQELVAAWEGLKGRLDQGLAEPPAPGDDPARAAVALWQSLRPLVFPAGAETKANSLQEFLNSACALRQDEMFCLSLKSSVTKKEAASLVTGRLVPILVIDAGGGLGREAATVSFEDVSSLPYRAFLTGMMSIPWPKARPLDMKGFISVVGVTSTTPRAEDQLQRTSLALLSRNYMNFSLCLGYHASTVEAFVDQEPPDNYVRFHYQGGAASVERRVRRLRLIEGILTRLGFIVSIEGDLLDGRRSGEPADLILNMLEILGRLEVYTKQMDMVMTDDEVVYGYVDDFLEKHC